MPASLGHAVICAGSRMYLWSKLPVAVDDREQPNHAYVSRCRQATPIGSKPIGRRSRPNARRASAREGAVTVA
jgi:hypothetical protein